MTESKPTKEEIISALKKYKAEYTFAEISEMIGVNKSNLTYIYYNHFKERIPLSKEAALRIKSGGWKKKIPKEKIDKVIEMGKNKIKVSEIIKETSLSRGFIYLVLKNNGITTPIRKGSRKEQTIRAIEAVKQYRDNYSYNQISEMTGIKLSVVARAVVLVNKELGIKNKYRKLTRNDKYLINEVAENNPDFSNRRVAKEVNVSQASVFRYIEREQNAPTQILTLEGLVEKYKHNQDFNVTPLFLIRTHNITPRLAAMVCEKLKERNG